MCVLVYLPVSRILPVSFAHTLCLHILPFFKLLSTSGKTMWDCLTMEMAPSSFYKKPPFCFGNKHKKFNR